MTEKFKILANYIKDLSSETPDIETFLFVKENISKYQLNIDITSKAIKNKLIEINTTLKFLREKNFWIYGFDTNAKKDFSDIEWKGNNVLLFGSEGFGLNQKTEKYVDYFVKIKINKDLESLNI